MALFQETLVEHLPHLSALARYFCRNRAMSDDLVQETVLRALCSVDKFEPGTNMKAWLSTILRNLFYNELRTCTRKAAYEAVPMSIGAEGNQEAHL